MEQDKILAIQSELLTGTALQSELNSRKKDYVYETISKKHQSNIRDKISDGWEIDKELKESLKLKKQKTVDILCEDKIWTMLCQMGFTVMSRGRNLKIPYDIENNLTQQIDVLAKDDDTILLVECKATKNNQIGDFKKELEAATGRYEGLIKTLKQVFSDKKYKYKYVLATMNYAISNPDKDRLKNLRGYHIDDESLGYYTELYKQIGTAAKYQLLGSMFAGEEIPGMDNQIPAVKGTMGGHVYFSFSIEPEKLLKISYVLHRSKANSELMPTYQRIIKKHRLRGIRQFIDKENGYFPNSIVISLDSDGRDIVFDRANTQSSGTITKVGILHLPKKYRSAYIIDGQHRLYGYSESEYKLTNSIPVVAFVDLDRAEQVKMFMQINENQKSVPKNLRITLNADLLWASESFADQFTALRSRIAIALGENRNSPLFGLVSVGEDKKIITQDPIIKSLKEGNFIGVASREEVEKSGTFYFGNLDKSYSRITEYLFLALGRFKEQIPDEWDNDRSLITMNRGIYALLRILSDFVDHAYKTRHVDSSSSVKDIYGATRMYIDSLSDYIGNLEQVKRDDLYAKLGYGAYTYYWRYFQKAIREKYPKFQPIGLKEYEARENKEYNKDAFDAISDIENKFKEFFKELLIDFYGDTWFEEGVPDSIQDTAVKLAQQKRRASKGRKLIEPWDCLSIVDYKNIAIKQKNWSEIFADVVTLPDEINKSGGKEGKTEWMQKLSEIRNQVVHEHYVGKDELDFVIEMRDFVYKNR